MVAGAFADHAGFGDRAQAEARDSLGGLDGFVAAFDLTGTPEWVTTVAGPEDDAVFDVECKDDGGVIVSGSYEREARFGLDDRAALVTTVDDDEDFFVARVEPGGRFSQIVVAGGAGRDVATDMAAGEDGGVLVAGFFEEEVHFEGPGAGTTLRSAGSRDVFIASLGPDLGLRWAWGLGAEGFDTPGGVGVRSDGCVVVGGGFSGVVDFDPGPGEVERASAGDIDAFVLWLGRDGGFQDVRTARGLGQDACRDIVVARDGSVVTVGTFYDRLYYGPGAEGAFVYAAGDETDRDVFLLAYDTAHRVTRAISTGSPLLDDVTGVAVDDDGHALISGYFPVDSPCVEMDGATVDIWPVPGRPGVIRAVAPDGQITWTRSVNCSGSAFGRFAFFDPDRGRIVAVGTHDLTEGGADCDGTDGADEHTRREGFVVSLQYSGLGDPPGNLPCPP